MRSRKAKKPSASVPVTLWTLESASSLRRAVALATGTSTSERTRPLRVASRGNAGKGARGTMMTWDPSST